MRARFERSLLISLGILTVLFVAWAGSASAAVRHEHIFSIIEVPSEGPLKESVSLSGPLSGVEQMTAADGKLYVYNHLEGTSTERIDEFDAASGAFISQFQEGSRQDKHGMAVAEANRLYVGGGNGTVDIFDLSGHFIETWTGVETPQKSFGNVGVTGVAVDNNSSNPGDWAKGDVYVANRTEGTVDVFKPRSGGGEELVAQLMAEPGVPFDFGAQDSSSYVAVNDSNGDVLIVNHEDSVYVFEPMPGMPGTYQFVLKITDSPSGALKSVEDVAVDSANGDIYAASPEIGVDYQFSAEGAFLGRLPGVNKVERSFAVDANTGNVFLGSAGGIDAFGPNIVVPDVVTGPVSNIKPLNVTLNGSVNPDGVPGATTCQFDWGATKALTGASVACEPTEVGEGSTPAAVHAALTGLQPDTTYYYSLQATDKDGTSQDEVIREFTTSGPSVNESSALNVASTSATLDATISPHGAPTSYYFQYGTDTSYGLEAPSAPGATIGAGEESLEVSQHLQGLSTGTTYHYRVVAVSEVEPGVVETFAGQDRSFTTESPGVFALPDGRSWELVSPPNKHGARIAPIDQSVVQASADGNAMTYVTDAPTEAEPKGYTNLLQVFSTDGPEGWSTRDIAIPHHEATSISIGLGQEYRSFSEDLSQAVVQPFGPFDPALSAEASEQTAFLAKTHATGELGQPCVSSCYQPLVTAAPGYSNVLSGTTFGIGGNGGKCSGGEVITCGPRFEAATQDLSHIVLQSVVGLTEDSKVANGLYEWSAGKLVPVGVLPDGEADAGAQVGYPGAKFYEAQAARNAISSDGSRVFWADSSMEHLYLRDTKTSSTIELDTVQSGSGAGSRKPIFQIASRDGSRAFFTDEQRLTGDAGTGDLYECEFVAEASGQLGCKLTDLTPSAEGDGEVQGAVDASEDGSWVYFVAGTDRLYVRHGGTTKLIAQLVAGDSSDWNGAVSSLKGLDGVTTRVSPDGRWLAFMSERGLTGYDTRDAVTGAPDQEVYLYNGESGQLVCASCDPTGARPVGVPGAEIDSSKGGLAGGDGVLDGEGLRIAANVPGWTPFASDLTRYQSRYLSNSGRLFFNSNDSLVPQDVNGTEDVYQYEPVGVGNCAIPSTTFNRSANGCVGLISAGTSAEESAFMDASESGGNVFFLTASKLLPQDYDTALDIYDAHECTSAAPCLAPPVVQPPPCDTGDSCKPAPTPQPASFGSPASSTFSGAGNVVPSKSGATVRSSGITRAQKLARALNVCRQKKRKVRVGCERRARKLYGAKKASKHKPAGKGR